MPLFLPFAFLLFTCPFVNLDAEIRAAEDALHAAHTLVLVRDSRHPHFVIHYRLGRTKLAADAAALAPCVVQGDTELALGPCRRFRLRARARRCSTWRGPRSWLCRGSRRRRRIQGRSLVWHVLLLKRSSPLENGPLLFSKSDAACCPP